MKTLEMNATELCKEELEIINEGNFWQDGLEWAGSGLGEGIATSIAGGEEGSESGSVAGSIGAFVGGAIGLGLGYLAGHHECLIFTVEILSIMNLLINPNTFNDEKDIKILIFFSSLNYSCEN